MSTILRNYGNELSLRVQSKNVYYHGNRIIPLDWLDLCIMFVIQCEDKMTVNSSCGSNSCGSSWTRMSLICWRQFSKGLAARDYKYENEVTIVTRNVYNHLVHLLLIPHLLASHVIYSQNICTTRTRDILNIL